MRIGFDNDKYIALQAEHIRDRISQFGCKLYVGRSYWRSLQKDRQGDGWLVAFAVSGYSVESGEGNS